MVKFGDFTYKSWERIHGETLDFQLKAILESITRIGRSFILLIVFPLLDQLANG